MELQQVNPKQPTEEIKTISEDILSNLVGSYQNFLQSDMKQEVSDEEKESIKQSLSNLAKFILETKDWIDNENNKKAVFYAIKTFGKDADLKSLKSLIDEIRNDEKQAYSNQTKASETQESRLRQMQSPKKTSSPIKSDTWFTREEIDKMTDTEYLKNGQKIALQMSLEKQGKLPRNLIK